MYTDFGGLLEAHEAQRCGKTMDDSKCDIDLAMHWSVAAKNSLLNVYGYSPNQLVFGKNPSLPSTHVNDLPAQTSTSTTEYITKTLQALHSARRAFIQQESSERLRRALSRKTRINPHFFIGDNVYYKRNDSKSWHGPAKVLGKDAQQYLLKHGGIYVRVHPCRIQLVQDKGAVNDQHMSQPCSKADAQTPPTPVDQADPESSDEDCSPNHAISTLTPPPTPAMDHGVVNGIPPSPMPLSPRPDLPNLLDLSSDSEPIEPQLEVPPAPPPPPPPPYPPRVPAALRRIQDFNKSPPRSPHAESASTEDIFFGDDSVRFEQAKLEELQKWKQMAAYEEVVDAGQPRISCRWVCTEKLKDGNTVLKARLVARGFEENNHQVQKDSPTCQRDSLRILLSVLTANNWQLKSIDIKSAYLQGLPLNRELYMKPPKLAQTDKLWRLLKCPYGISDAGRHWYLRVVKELKRLEANQVKLDQAVFVWFDPSGSLCGIMVIHVDDFLFGGTSTFHHQVIDPLRSTFQIGTEVSSGMKYLGLMITQTSIGISVSTDPYCQGLKEMPTDLNPDELKKELRHTSGQLNWVATQSRPDLAYDNCVIGNSITKAEAKDAQRANKTVRKAKGQEVSLHYPTGLLLRSCRIIGFCDASFANLPDRGSQGAFIIFLCDDNGLTCVISWQSRRVRRTVNSTLAAECLAAVEAAEACIYLRHILQEIMGITQLSATDFPISILCDNRSLVDAVHSSTSVQNKWLQIDISVLRDMIQTVEIEEFRWVPTKLQIANALTKAGTSPDYLLRVLRRQLRFHYSSGAFM